MMTPHGSPTDGSLGGARSVGPPKSACYDMENWSALGKPRPGLKSRHQAFHQEMRSEAASSGSQLKAAVPAKRAGVKKEVETK